MDVAGGRRISRRRARAGQRPLRWRWWGSRSWVWKFCCLLGFQALYGYVYHELTILVALFMVGVALGAWWELRSAPSRGRASLRRDLRLLAGLQIVLAASPLLLYGLFIQLGRREQRGGQRAASEILFPALALVAGLLGGFQFLLASRVVFWRRAGKRPLARRALCPGPCRRLRRGSGAERSADSRLRISAHGGADGRGESGPGSYGGCCRWDREGIWQPGLRQDRVAPRSVGV